jgi:hypothetical protein
MKAWKQRIADGYKGITALTTADIGHSFRPPPTAELAGTEMSLHFADGSCCRYQFESGERLAWSPAGDIAGGRGDYVAVAAGDGIYFIDHRIDGVERRWVGMVVDTRSGRITFTRARIPEDNEADSLVQLDIRGASLHAAAAARGDVGHPRASLSGKRFVANYGSHGAWEQYYLNERLIAWHGIRGPSPGVADIEEYAGFQVDDSRRIVVWAEGAEPMMLMILLDFERNTIVGTMLGFDFTRNVVAHSRAGARIVPMKAGQVAASFEDEITGQQRA